MALLSNINDKFAVDSTGAIQFNGQVGTSGYILKSNGNAAPTWIPQSDIVSAYLPLAGGTLTGNLTINGSNSLTVGGVTTLNDLDVTDTLAWRVSPTDAARQRADARDDDTTFSRLHWFGKSDTAQTSNFRHAYYDGANYINVTAASGTVTFDGILAATGGTSTEWNTSYDNSITGLAVTGTTTKTLTATQQDGGTLTASWTDDNSGTVTSSAAASYIPYMSTATNVANSQLIYDTTNSRTILTATVGPNDDIRGSFVVRDDTAMAANVGGQIALGYRYLSSGAYTEGALIRTYKLNATSNDYSSGLKIQVRNTGTSLSTKFTLDPSGNVTIPGSLTFNGTSTSPVGMLLRVDSGNVNAITIDNVGSTTFSGYTYFPNYLFHEGDTNTRIQFTTGTITLRGDSGITLDGPTTTNANFIGTTATFTGLVSGITPTAAANFATKAYVDAHPGDNTTWPNVGAGTRTNYTLSFKPPTANYAGFQFLTSAGAGAGYLLIRGASDAGQVYKAEGITLVSDSSWVTIASRTTTDAGVRLMSGSTSAERLVIKDNGESYFTGNLGIGVTTLTGNGGLMVTNTEGVFANADQKRVASFYDGSVNANNPGIILGYDDSSTPHGIVGARTQTGSGTIPGLQFFTYDGGWGPRMTILNTGKVGIGTTGPQQPLHVQSTGDLFTRYNAGSSANGVQFQTWHGASQTMTINSNTTNPFAVYVGSASGTIAINVNSNANVSIGTTVQGYRGEKLFIDGEVRQQSTVGVNPLGATRGGLAAYDNTTGWGAGIGGQLVLGYIYTGSAYTEGALIKMYKQNSTQGHYGSGLRWAVRENGTNLTPKMDLSPSGTLTVIQDIVAYGSPSDKKLKENIKPISLALDKVTKLQGVTFDWKESDSMLNIKEDIGFIAQDVQKVVPELVRKNSNGLLSMRHQGVIPMLVEAIKELEARVKELENK
jgi:hypothetical protein